MKALVTLFTLAWVLTACSGDRIQSHEGGKPYVATSDYANGMGAAKLATRSIGASIAGAPDRGALLAYGKDDSVVLREGAMTLYPVTVSEAHAFKALTTGELTVPTPNGGQVKLRYDRHDEDIGGNWTWIGHADGDRDQDAIITFGPTAVFGVVPQPNGQPELSLTTRDGVTYIVKMDPTRAMSGAMPDDMLVAESKALRASVGVGAQAITSNSAGRLAAQSGVLRAAATGVQQAATPTPTPSIPINPMNTVDVAFGYPPDFELLTLGPEGAATRLVFLTRYGNEKLNLLMDVMGELRIVHITQVDYPSDKDSRTALVELTGSDGQFPVPVPKGLQPLRQARETHGADIAVLVRSFKASDYGGCGAAWLNGAGLTSITSAHAAYGYAVVNVGSYVTADGKDSLLCGDDSLIHQVAHLMGATHDRASSRDADGNLLYGTFPYSFAYKSETPNRKFHTFMAYAEPSRLLIPGSYPNPTFSTPANLCKPDAYTWPLQPCGVVDSEDALRTLRQTFPIVSQFRESVVPFAGKLSDDINADGRADLMWYFPPTRDFYYWTMDGRTITEGRGGFQIAPGYLAREVADFNGDNAADILWSDGQFLRMFIANASGGYTDTLVARHPPGQEIIGSGDTNLDGRDDLLWFNPTTREFSIWLMNGPVIRNYLGNYHMGSNYTVRGIGDFNGDTAPDVLFSNGTELRIFWSTYGSSSRKEEFFYHDPVGWQFVGAGDIDGDRLDDVMWFHPGTGEFTYWLMHGTRLKGARDGIYFPPGFTPRKVTDFNGDTLADILISDGVELRIMMNSQRGGFTEVRVNSGYPTGWTLLGQ